MSVRVALGMEERRIAGGDEGQLALHVAAHIRVGGLVDRERRRRVQRLQDAYALRDERVGDRLRDTGGDIQDLYSPRAAHLKHCGFGHETEYIFIAADN
jgi:hypothetical protein